MSKNYFGKFNSQFLDHDLEEKFLSHNLGVIKKLIFIVMIIFTLNNFFLLLNQILSNNELYSSAYLILASRGMTFIFGCFLLINYKKFNNYKVFRNLMFIYLMSLGLANGIIHFAYPEPENLKYAFEIMIILTIYLVFPIGIPYQIIGALFFSLSIFMSLNSSIQSNMTYAYSLGMMINCNLIGYLIARYYQKNVRKMFLIYINESNLKEELQNALDELKTITGLVPICKTCKNVQNVDGDWDRIEAFIDEHSEIKLTHSMCPECTVLLYNEIQEYKNK